MRRGVKWTRGEAESVCGASDLLVVVRRGGGMGAVVEGRLGGSLSF